jgi:hypothetical protein
MNERRNPQIITVRKAPKILVYRSVNDGFVEKMTCSFSPDVI